MFLVSMVFGVAVYKTWGCWRPVPLKYNLETEERRESQLECMTTIGSVILEIADYSSDIWVVVQISQNSALNVWYTICYLTIIIVAGTFNLFNIYRRFVLLTKVQGESVVPNGWLAKQGGMSRKALRGYENQLLTLLAAIIEDIPAITLTIILVMKGHGGLVIQFSCGISLLCLGLKLSALEKLKMWISIGIGQQRLDNNKGRRVHERTLDNFLDQVEQDERLLKGLTVSSGCP